MRRGQLTLQGETISLLRHSEWQIHVAGVNTSRLAHAPNPPPESADRATGDSTEEGRPRWRATMLAVFGCGKSVALPLKLPAALMGAVLVGWVKNRQT